MSNILKAALDELNRETFAGVEFSDALDRILLAFPEVSQGELTESYDKQTFSQFLMAAMGISPVENQGEPI
jgi:hypothetical protein